MKKIVRYFAASVKVWKNAFPTDKHTGLSVTRTNQTLRKRLEQSIRTIKET